MSIFKNFFKKNEKPSTVEFKKTLDSLTVVKNEKFEELNFFKERWINTSQQREDWGNFKHVFNINIELSNLCNYSLIHKKCPLNKISKTQVLSSKLFYKIIDEVSIYDFTGIWQFFMYNEPMIDPRLFLFVKYTKEKCPNSKIFISTNGFWTNQTMLRELEEIGVDFLYNSAYSVAEYERLSSLKDVNIGYCVDPMLLDTRTELYDKEPINFNNPCNAPLNELCIASNGEMRICCLDWKGIHAFGSLCEKSLMEIINSNEVSQVYADLLKGNRNLFLCKRCNWTR